MAILKQEIIGNQRLILGDCLMVMPLLGYFDAVVTDPPYGIKQDGGKFRERKGGGARVLPKKSWDKDRPPKKIFDLIFSISHHKIIWGGNYFADLLPPSRGWLYWSKLMGGDFADGELAYTSLDCVLRQFTLCNKMKGKIHPTQKPDDLMKWCINRLPKDTKTILDPFLGSGTTLVACEKLGLQGTGIELDQDYFKAACKRVDEAARQPSLFCAKISANKQMKQGVLFDGY
tara:strand:- start:43 stop:735 length:693 start_codon:yes stop_codon:yes gene_type:complete